ncbi:hydroxysqualene dehydroxylase HpnE [Bergeriella denitrificans]|uniref:Oxidoreductase n=1 Tax=Bergeriella denitrificans TaxID=494 RepID=A0A378UEQ0_BERDE|nr:hydroxysqualene dehydroxylase HpnE [Bergeriella denitrificans]STZ75888.1 oxidoreductase [Bergeriella denitrificans]
MTPTRTRPKIAVIGAGWAGLSAAVQLVRRADLTLFEAGRKAGGRARASGGGSHGFSFLDNGQHICIGAYRSVSALLTRIGVNEQNAFLRLPLQWYLHDGLRFQTAPLPAPLHLAVGVLLGKNAPLGQKVRLLRDMAALKRHHAAARADCSVADWLRRRRVPRKLMTGFWQPLVWGALNTPLETASLNTLAHVLRDGVWAAKSSSDYLIPKRDLGSIMAEPALAYLRRHGADIRLSTRAPQPCPLPDGRISIGGETFDAVIMAVAPQHAAALLPDDTPADIQTAYRNIRHHAITTVYLRYARPVALPAALTGFSDGTAQWLIRRGALGLPDNEIAAVISVSGQCGIGKAEDWAAAVHADVLRVCPDVGEPLAAQVITEKRATHAAAAGRVPPDLAWLHRRRIFPAGDYLHPRYPATLEAAVQSGISAADECLAALKAV